MKTPLDDYLPVWDHNEIHQIFINRTPDEIYPCLLSLDMNRSKLIKALFLLRGLPFRDIRLDRLLSAGPFELLEEQPGKELVMGLLTSATLSPVSFSNAREFLAYAPDAGLKIAWNFRIEPGRERGRSRLTTETRIRCLGRRARVFFSAYWFFIRPFSGLIRMEMLRIVRQEAEA